MPLHMIPPLTHDPAHEDVLVVAVAVSVAKAAVVRLAVVGQQAHLVARLAVGLRDGHVDVARASVVEAAPVRVAAVDGLVPLSPLAPGALLSAQTQPVALVAARQVVAPSVEEEILDLQRSAGERQPQLSGAVQQQTALQRTARQRTAMQQAALQLQIWPPHLDSATVHCRGLLVPNAGCFTGHHHIL